jgi:hypothetical protein
MTVSGRNILRDLSLGLLVLLAIGAAGLLRLSWVQVNWQADVARIATVGMTEEDLIDRLGPPTVRIAGPEDPRAAELGGGGYWTPQREYDGPVLVWQLRDPALHAALRVDVSLWRLHVYLDEDGMAECVSLGNT